MRNILWTLSTLIGICSMFSVTLFYIPSYNYSQIESALYNSLHRLGWSIFTGWLVLGCATSEGNALKTFLSSQILVPLSRLTYCAYLTNGFIELYMAASIRTPKHMSTSNLVSNYFHLKSKSYFIFKKIHRLVRHCLMSHSLSSLHSFYVSCLNLQFTEWREFYFGEMQRHIQQHNEIQKRVNQMISMP